MNADPLSQMLLQRLSHAHTGLPRNRALYLSLKACITDGSLVPGLQLPPTRSLASRLSISRNTVLFAYEQLLAEGYVEARTGSGTFVCAVWSDEVRPAPRRVNAPTGWSDEVRISRRAEQLLAGARAQRAQWGAFMPGVPDVTDFPHRLWSRLVAKHWRDVGVQDLTYGGDGGHADLRSAVAEHLRASRSVVCEPEQVLITDGIHQALHLCALMLADPGDTAWVEEPGYWGIRNVWNTLGLKVTGVRVDEEGMDPNAADSGRPARLICVTPSHQYPSGHVMSLTRRRALLELAQRHGSWIVEDDYDSEFRYGGWPLAALQGLQPGARVLYTGTFSKTLFPGLRIGYLVVPTGMVTAFRAGLAELFREGRRLTQAVLAEFIAQGYYQSHVRRMRQVYERRRNALLAAVTRHLGESVLMSADARAGLHLVLRLPGARSDQAICRRALQQGVIALPLSRYYAGPEPVQGLVLGYGCVHEKEIDARFRVLVKAVRG